MRLAQIINMTFSFIMSSSVLNNPRSVEVQPGFGPGVVPGLHPPGVSGPLHCRGQPHLHPAGHQSGPQQWAAPGEK